MWMSVALAVFSFAMVMLCGGAAGRLLGQPFGRLRVAGAGLVALLLTPTVTKPLVSSAERPGEGDAAIAFALLAMLLTVLIAMVVLVVAEALLPSRPGGGVLAWREAWLQRWGRLVRYLQILRIVTAYGLGRYLTRRPAPVARPGHDNSRARLARTLRQALDEAGGTFVKLGQSLAARRDLLAVEFADELQTLQDSAAAAAWPQVRDVLTAELGRPLGEVFAEFDPEPLAAASIAQVHRGRLRSGEPVVVKVRRPGVERLVARDLDIIGRLASRLESSTRWGRALGLRRLAEGFAASLREELDFRVEAANLQALGAGVESAGSRVAVPRVYEQWSGRRVLVMEQLPGRTLADLAASPTTAARSHAKAAVLLADDFVRQIAVDGIVHADPHPGNVVLLPDGRPGLIDLGSVGRLGADLRRGLGRLLMALDADRPAAARDALLDVVDSPDDLDVRELQRDLGRFRVRHLGPGGSGGAVLFGGLLRLAAQHRLVVPPELAAVFRAVITLDGTLQRLDPGFDLVAHVQRSVRGQLLRGPGRTPDLLAEAGGWASALAELPMRVERVLTVAERGAAGKVRLFAAEPDRRFATGLVHQGVATLLSATTGVMAVLLLGAGNGPMVTATVSLYQVFGYHLLAVSAILGLRVMVPIFRSVSGDPG